MNKKPLSIILTTLFLLQSIVCSPINAKNTISKSDKKTTTANPDNSNRSNENKQWDFLPKTVFSSAFLGSLAALTIYLVNNKDKSNKNPNITCRQKDVLNKAINKLYNSEFKNHILSFPFEEAELLLNNFVLDFPINSALTISIALHQAFNEASSNPSAIDLKSNKRLLTILSKNILKSPKDFQTFFHNVVDISNQFINQTKKNLTDTKVNYTTHVLKKRENVREMAKKWQNTHHTPIRSLKWHHHLCWLHASVLLFFYEEHYHNFINNFPIDRARDIINSKETTNADKEILEAMITLSRLFNDLSQKPESLAVCVNYSKTKYEKYLLEKLKKAFKHVSTKNYNDMKYGTDYDLVTDELFSLIKHSSELLQLDSTQLPNLHGDGKCFENHTELRVVQSYDFEEAVIGGHFWVELSIDGEEKKLAIGELLSAVRSIDVEQSENPRHF